MHFHRFISLAFVGLSLCLPFTQAVPVLNANDDLKAIEKKDNDQILKSFKGLKHYNHVVIQLLQRYDDHEKLQPILTAGMQAIFGPPSSFHRWDIKSVAIVTSPGAPDAVEYVDDPEDPKYYLHYVVFAKPKLFRTSPNSVFGGTFELGKDASRSKLHFVPHGGPEERTVVFEETKTEKGVEIVGHILDLTPEVYVHADDDDPGTE
ncbi:hypothetical protein EV360DRAFT_76109 [Lentinula raphanica]|nr:hypothetical protein EV360DRAFT_76109 [Lentinula raphanica]